MFLHDSDLNNLVLNKAENILVVLKLKSIFNKGLLNHMQLVVSFANNLSSCFSFLIFYSTIEF